MQSQALPSKALICPSSSDTAAPGETPEQQANDLHTGGHLSFIYGGNGLTLSDSKEIILLCEPIANHRDGSNVLFMDGHVEFMKQDAAQYIIDELSHGQNPPKWEQWRSH
jgi:prepilin-type processing-associated H-X9-DG protein